MKIVNNLVLIPSRIGSKRVKNKNFIILKKKKLYEHSLQHAYLIKKKFKSTIIALSTDYVGKLKKKIILTLLKDPKTYLEINLSQKNIFFIHYHFIKKKKLFLKMLSFYNLHAQLDQKKI